MMTWWVRCEDTWACWTENEASWSIKTAPNHFVFQIGDGDKMTHHMFGKCWRSRVREVLHLQLMLACVDLTICRGLAIQAFSHSKLYPPTEEAWWPLTEAGRAIWKAYCWNLLNTAFKPPQFQNFRVSTSSNMFQQFKFGWFQDSMDEGIHILKLQDEPQQEVVARIC